jgi:lipoprotein-releasing system permease protein
VVAITAATAAMFIILSGFGGFEGLIQKMFSEFDPEYRIKHKTQKYFTFSPELQQSLEESSIVSYSKIIEEKCIFRSPKGNEIGFLKGVESNYSQISDITKDPFHGEFVEFRDSLSDLFMGISLQGKLSLSVQNIHSVVDVWVPKANNKTYLNPEKAFRSHTFYLNGVFHVGQEYDGNYAFASLEDVQKLVGKKNEVTAIELKADSLIDPDIFEDQLQNILETHDLEVFNRKEQHAEILKFINLEQKFILLIFVLVMVLASFNLLGSIAILILEKKENMQTLTYLGAQQLTIKNIYFYLSFLMSSMGLVAGLFLGLIICFLQQEYQLVRMGAHPGALPYPIEMKYSDVFWIITIVMVTTLLTSFLRIRKIKLK